MRHLAEHNRRFKPMTSKRVLNELTELLSVHKDNCLCQRTNVEYFHYKVDFLFGLASVFILLDVVELESFLLQSD